MTKRTLYEVEITGDDGDPTWTMHVTAAGIQQAADLAERAMELEFTGYDKHMMARMMATGVKNLGPVWTR